MTQFFNAREEIVTEAIEGLVLASGGRLVRLDGFPHIRVVLRADWARDRVALVSGGGSGHEPAHAGFVGPGMLTAAVCGDVFASPSVDAALAGILAVTGPAGCLLVVKNYTGDRLNFGLAAERARAFGLKVEMVVVDDDVALPDLAQARGIAGTLFVHKVAGALAETGAALAEVAALARRVAGATVSLGMSLDTCTVPGSPKDNRIPEGEAELGLGIHGESGAEHMRFTSARAAMTTVVDRLARYAGPGPKAALLNNLGATTPLEMAILARELLATPLGADIHLLAGPAPLMTSLDMHGFSVSLLPLDNEIARYLAAPTGCAAWAPAAAPHRPELAPIPDGLTPLRPSASADPATAAFLARCCDILMAAEADLNALDARSGDGDTGSTLAGAARDLRARIPDLPLADLTQLFRAVGAELSQTMGGSSGVLLAIFFSAVGDAASAGARMADALRAGLARVSEVGGAAPGDRTMIDALGPALEALPQGLAAAASAARTGADATARIARAGAGRASYIGADRLLGWNDPGAEAVARLFEHLSR